MDLGDPMVLPEGAASGGNGEGASDGDHPVAWVPLAGDEDLVEHLRPDEIEVMAEELGMAMGRGPVPIDTVDLEDMESASECEEEEDASEAAAAPPPEAAAAASVEATHIVEECVKAAITSPARYISCPFGKWAQKPCIGRVTTWPASQSIANRSVSLKCYFHKSFASPAKKRRTVSDDVLYTLLFFCFYEKYASSARKQALPCPCCPLPTSDALVRGLPPTNSECDTSLFDVPCNSECDRGFPFVFLKVIAQPGNRSKS